MKVSSFTFESSFEYLPPLPFEGESVDLVILFGLRETIESADMMNTIRAGFPNAKIAGCSSAGELYNGEFALNSLVVMTVVFEGSRCEDAFYSLEGVERPAELGSQIAARFAAPDLKAVLLFGEGVETDCEPVIESLIKSFDEQGDAPKLFGGLAGDNLKFSDTVVVSSDGVHAEGLVAVGLYGDQLHVTGGSSTTWPMFEQELTVTRGDANLVHEFNGRPAVEVYSEIVGQPAKEAMKSSGFHPVILIGDDGSNIARTVFSFDEDTGSMMFAGNVTGNVRVANFEFPDQLLDGVSSSLEAGLDHEADLVLAVSCAGRRITLGPSVFKEAEPLKASIPADIPLIGFYGYGEVGYSQTSEKNEFLNHSFSVFSLREAQA